jgi:hypothetical protein
VLGVVAAVINDDVKWFFSRSNVVPELRRSLVANDDLYSVASIRHAGGLDVDPCDMRPWPKVVGATCRGCRRCRRQSPGSAPACPRTVKERCHKPQNSYFQTPGPRFRWSKNCSSRFGLDVEIAAGVGPCSANVRPSDGAGGVG